MGLPFFGCILHYGLRPREFLINIGNKYGSIAYIPLMASNNLFISDPKILKILYQNKKIINRPTHCVDELPPFGLLNGKSWIKRRKYVMDTILSLSKTSFILINAKKCIYNYIETILNEKYINNKALWYPADYLKYINFNITFSAIFNKTLPFNDVFIAKYFKALTDITWALGTGILFDIMMNGIDILPKYCKWHIAKKYRLYSNNLMIEWMNNNGFIVDLDRNILKRENNYNDDDDDNNNKKHKVYIDYLIEKLNDNEITSLEIINDVQFTLGGSIDTTSKSSEYGLLLLAKYPNIQETIYMEIINVMKKHNLKDFNFKILNELHIFRAFIHEMLRISSPAVTGAPHATIKQHKIEINGKTIIIPKHTILHQNTYYIQKFINWNNGKALKKDNNEIHLDYWLDSNDKTFKMNDNFVLFSTGKRNCVGKSFAIKSIYAIFGLLMIKYKFIAQNNNINQINIKQKWGITLSVDPQIGIIIQTR